MKVGPKSFQISHVLQWSEEHLRSVNSERARLEARLLLSHSLQKPSEFLIAYDETLISEKDFLHFSKLVERRKNFEPIAYIRGVKEFFGREFLVNQDVLVPRPETEELVKEILQWAKERTSSEKSSEKIGSVVDLGTGSGCIILSLAAEINASQFIGLDISEAALRVAAQNAQKLKIPQVLWRHEDMKVSSRSSEIGDDLDILVSNPPYIPSENSEELPPDVKNFEPSKALIGGERGLDFYRSIIENWLPRLRRGGLMALETFDADQRAEIQSLIRSSMIGKIWEHGPHLFFERTQ